MALTIRKGRPEDFESYYNMKCEYSSIVFGGFSTLPNKENLRNYYDKLITDQISGIKFFSIEEIPIEEIPESKKMRRNEFTKCKNRRFEEPIAVWGGGICS